MLSGMLQQATVRMGESEGSNQLAYGTIPQLEQSLERKREEQERAKKRSKRGKEGDRESWAGIRSNQKVKTREVQRRK